MIFPVRLACQYCNGTLEMQGESVQVCDCPEARKAEAAERERTRQHAKQKPSWIETRERNKMSRRRGNE
jgi:hypothetical protein